MFTEYNDRHSNFVVLVICYEHKAIADAKKVTKNSGIEDKVTNGKASTSNGKAKIVRKWSEFRLPLNENQVLEWSQLPNNSELKFYHVPTFKHCIENGLDFVNYPNHVINDGQVLGKEELKQKDCYFVFTSDTYSIDFDPKKEEVKSKMISNFSHLFEIDTDTSLFYLEASDFDLNLAVKNYCASQRSKSLEDLFLLNSKNGKADIISLLLNVEFDKTCKNNLGMNALHLAVRYQHLDCVKLLLQSKLKNQLNGQDGIGNLPLHLACLGSNIPLVELLLKETRDITLKNVEKETILHSLCKGQANIEIFDPLFARICEHFDEDFTKYSKFFNLLNDDNESAFMIAVRKNHFHFVQHIVNSQLFSSLFNLNLKNKLGQSILIVACKEDAVQSLQILLPSCSQMIMEKDERGFTPLHYATLFNCLASSSLLLQYLDIQQYNTVLFHNSITPLEHAVSQNNIDLLRLHLNYLTNNSTPNSNIINHMPQLLFLCIKQHRSIEMVKEILQYQIDINQNTEGYVEYSIFETTTPKFPLLDCVLNDSKTIFKFLIRQPNINVNQQSKETGMTALHYAIIKHYLKPTEHSKYFIMKLIKKTDLSIQDHFLRTALHLSKLCEFKDISESIEALNESRYIKDLSDIPCKDYTKECSFANNLLFEKYAKYVTLLQTQSTSKSVNYKLLHGVYLQHEILNFLYTTKLSVNDLQSIYKRVSYLQKHLPSVHFIKHINLPIFPQLLNFKYENNNLHLVYSSNTLFEQTSSCRFYLDNNLLTHPIHQFSTMLKIISSIYVLHYSNITHGNIKPNSFRFVNDTKLLYIYDYGLLSNQLDEKQSSPEIKACKNGAIYDILAKKSNDIFNLGHVLHEVLFGSKYGEKDFSVTSIVQQLYSTIMACFTENEEFRPDIKEIYEAIKVTIQNLIEMLKESNNSKKDPARILEMELKLVDVMISRYGYNDHGKPQEMNATQNIGKCITKINELVKTEQLSILNVFNQMPEHLDINTIKQLFSTIHYLIQVLNDKFKAAAFDLLRVLLLKKECVEYLLTHHENLTLVDILERMKNVNNVDGFTLTLISSCIAHCLIHPIGLNYFTNHLDKYDLLVTFILQLLNSTTNQEKNVFNAAMILHNLRFNVQRIGDQLPPILADHLTILVQTQLNFPFIEKSETSQRNTRSLLETCVSTLNRLTSSLSNNTVAATSVSVVKDTVKLISLSLYSIIKLDSNCIPYLKNLNFQQLESVIDYKLYNALFHLSLDFTNEEKEYVGLSSRILYKPSKD